MRRLGHPYPQVGFNTDSCPRRYRGDITSAYFVRGPILLLGDRLEPCRSVTVAGAFDHGNVRHRSIRGTSVPVLLPRWAPDRFTRTDLGDLARPGDDKPDAFDDVEGLSDRVGVPVRPGARCEPHVCGSEPGRLDGLLDHAEVHVADKPARRSLDRVANGLVLQRHILTFNTSRGWLRVDQELLGRSVIPRRYGFRSGPSGRQPNAAPEKR